MVHVLLCDKVSLNSDHWFGVWFIGFMAYNTFYSVYKSPWLAESQKIKPDEILKPEWSSVRFCKHSRNLFRLRLRLEFFMNVGFHRLVLILGHIVLLMHIFATSLSANMISPFSLGEDQKRCLPREKLPTQAAPVRAGTAGDDISGWDY